MAELVISCWKRKFRNICKTDDDSTFKAVMDTSPNFSYYNGMAFLRLGL